MVGMSIGNHLDPNKIVSGASTHHPIERGEVLATIETGGSGRLTIHDAKTNFTISFDIKCTGWNYSVRPNGTAVIRGSLDPNARNITLPRVIGGLPVVGLSGVSWLENPNITSVTIHDGITTIMSSAFTNAPNLTTLTFQSATPPSFGAETFVNAPNLTTIRVPLGAKAAYEAVEELQDFDIKIEEHDSPIVQARDLGDVNILRTWTA
jgi:hypothetical protein